jgi:hypothetical protein
VRTAYLGHRAAYYALESRWADEPFWRRRNGVTPRASSQDSPIADGAAGATDKGEPGGR